MNKLMTEDMGRVKQKKEALGRALSREIPVGNADRDSSMDDVVKKLGGID